MKKFLIGALVAISLGSGTASILSTPTTQTKKTSPQNGKKTTQLKK